MSLIALMIRAALCVLTRAMHSWEKAVDTRAKTRHFPKQMAARTSKLKPSDKQIRVAEDVILGGKSFRQAALDAGHSESVANKGARIYTKEHPGMQAAFVLAAQKADLNAQTVHTVAKYRLFDDVVKAKDSGVTRQIELLGRMKEHDWFVRNTDVQIGIFAGLAEDEKLVSGVTELAAELPPAEPEKEE